MTRAALLFALCACTRTVDVARAVDTQQRQEAVANATASAVVEAGPVTTVVEEWEEPETPEPMDAGVPALASPAPHALLHHRRTTTTQQALSVAGPAVRVTQASAAQVRTSATAETHLKEAEHDASRPSLGFQLWLVLIPAGLIAAGLLVWRVFKWIP